MARVGVVEALDDASVTVAFDDGTREKVVRRLVTLRAPPPSCAFAPFSVGEVDQDDAEHAPPSAGHLEVLLRAYAKDPAPADALAREEACVALVQCAVADARARPTAHSRSEAARKADLRAVVKLIQAVNVFSKAARAEAQKPTRAESRAQRALAGLRRDKTKFLGP